MSCVEVVRLRWVEIGMFEHRSYFRLTVVGEIGKWVDNMRGIFALDLSKRQLCVHTSIKWTPIFIRNSIPSIFDQDLPMIGEWVTSINAFINSQTNSGQSIAKFKLPFYRRSLGCHFSAASYWDPCSRRRLPLGGPSEPHIRERCSDRICSSSLWNNKQIH